MIPERPDIVVVHYAEIALKLGHRRMFERHLLQNLRSALCGLAIGPVRSLYGRMIVDLGEADSGDVTRRLAVLPGIANVLVARSCGSSIEDIDACVQAGLREWQPRGSFRVIVRRPDKRFPMRSIEVARRTGQAIVDATGAPVKLKNPDETVYIEITTQGVFVAFERVEGCGGLPVHSGGRVLLLLSGGIDSPVAGLRMQRRGCILEAVHFHSVPFLDKTSQEKAHVLASLIARGQDKIVLHMVAFGELQSEVVRSVPLPLRVVIYRRMMMRIASRMCGRVHAGALVTGESLGQVASQTMTNLATIEDAAEIPVLRPLVGSDKLEITRYAQDAGTFEVSIVPDQDCCTLFVPKHPATAASIAEAEAAEANLAVEALVTAALDSVVTQTIAAEWGEPRL